MDPETIKEIHDATLDVDPGDNEYRKGRLTASGVGKYLNCQEKKSPADPITYLRKMFDEKFSHKTTKGNNSQESWVSKCLQYGRDKEPEAKMAFKAALGKKLGQPVKLWKQGFYCDKEVGIFGCTPDGLVELPDGEKALLETKCPFAVSSSKSIRDICTDPKKMKTFELVYDTNTDDYSINWSSFKGRKYYDQIQLSMWVTGYEKTFFCVYIPTDTVYLSIKKDDDWARRNIPNLCRLFRDFYAPAMKEQCGEALCELNIKNQAAFDKYAEEGVPLEEWPEKVWFVERVKPRDKFAAAQRKLRKKEAWLDRKRDYRQQQRRRWLKYRTNRKGKGIEYID